MMLPGVLTDRDGTETVLWSIADSSRPGWRGRYEVTADVRGVRICGTDFTDLAPETATAALPLNTAGELSDCDLTIEIPAIVEGTVDGSAGLVLTFHLGTGQFEPLVDASLTIGPTTIAASQEERLEQVLGALVSQLGQRAWECCLTCGLSDYSPGGNANMGMRCHRETRSEYLASRGKWEYWAIPVTEEVPEFYRCDQWEPRQPGTGYRG